MNNTILYIFFILLELIQYKNIFSKNASFQGSAVTNNQLYKLEIGKNNKNEVINILGNPSIIDPFTNKIWFYISYNIIRNKINNINKIILYFNEDDILIKIKK